MGIGVVVDEERCITFELVVAVDDPKPRSIANRNRFHEACKLLIRIVKDVNTNGIAHTVTLEYMRLEVDRDVFTIAFTCCVVLRRDGIAELVLCRPLITGGTGCVGVTHFFLGYAVATGI
jgi:hypothetical protein